MLEDQGGRTEAVCEKLSDQDYEVLKTWYEEGLRIARYLVIFSFAAIGFTITLLQLRPDGGADLTADQATRIRVAWAFLAISGSLAGVTVLIAFLWLDAIHRVRAPALTQNLRGRAGTYRRMWLIAKAGWTTTICATVALLIGLALVISFAWSTL